MNFCLLLTTVVVAVFSAVLIVIRRNSIYDETTAPLGSGTMFNSIARQYDAVNKFLSLGMDMSWRRTLVKELELKINDRVIDIATGTGDVAILEAEYFLHAMGNDPPKIKVLGIDPSTKMIEIGQDKIRRKQLESIVDLREGDAQAMYNIPTGFYDKVSMSFGIRNVLNRNAALREIRRISKDSATIAILEVHAPNNGAFSIFGRLALWLLPTLLGAITGAYNQYDHLKNSALSFPSPDEWEAQMAANGLAVYKRINLFVGAIWLYLAHPLEIPMEEK